MRAQEDASFRTWAVARRPHLLRMATALTAGDRHLAEDLTQRTDLRTVRDALAQLPPNQRAAVVLRHLLELDVDECADLLGCPAGTVRTRTHRGLLRLRTLLTELDAEGVRS